MGDTVLIRTTPNMNVNTYNIGQTITYQVPTSTPTSLTISNGLYWAYQVDDIDRYQADIELLDNFTQSAVQQTMVTQDQNLLATIPSQVAASNQGTAAGIVDGNINLGSVASPLVITSSNAVDSILFAAAQCLDNQNIPYDGRRWIVLPSWLIRKLRNSEMKLVYETGDAISPARNGKVGRIADFEVYQTNNISAFQDNYVNTWNIPFGWSPGLAWAAQFTETKMVDLVNQIGLGVRSVLAYGFNTVQPLFTGNIVAQAGVG